MDFESLPKRKVIKGIPFKRDVFGCYVPVNAEGIVSKIKVQKAADCLPVLNTLRHAKFETIVVITLDAGHQIIGVHETTRGLVNQSLCHPREIFEKAYRDLAVAIILAHNHPSGLLDPSADDLLCTKRMLEASKVLGIKFLDHLIVGETGYLSIKERIPHVFQ
jgi:DNA repair protein RadC